MWLPRIIITAGPHRTLKLPLRKNNMRHIRNFLHNINDVVLAIVIVLLAAGIIYWRMQIIMDYPKQLANENAAVEQQEEAAEAATAEEEAAPAEEAPAEESASGEEASQGETAPAEEEQTEQAAEEQPEG